MEIKEFQYRRRVVFLGLLLKSPARIIVVEGLESRASFIDVLSWTRDAENSISLPDVGRYIEKITMVSWFGGE